MQGEEKGILIFDLCNSRRCLSSKCRKWNRKPSQLQWTMVTANIAVESCGLARDFVSSISHPWMGIEKLRRGRQELWMDLMKVRVEWKLITKVKKTLNSRHDQETALI